MRRRVEEARVGRLATVRPDGRPHVVPFVFALDGEHLYSSIDAKPKRTTELQRIRNIEANPAVEVVVDDYHEPWPGIWWVRLRGRAEVLEDGPERDRAMELLIGKYPDYEEDPPDGAIVAVRIDRWAGWKYRPGSEG